MMYEESLTTLNEDDLWLILSAISEMHDLVQGILLKNSGIDRQACYEGTKDHTELNLQDYF